jgi:hypothetical protein
MSMHINAEQLEILAAKLRIIQETGIEVKMMHFEHHDVYLGVDNAGALIVRGINDKIDQPADNKPVNPAYHHR